MSELSIHGIKIGEGHPPFIIAEVGINHNGELDKAFEMIRLAKHSGVDAVKFQTFKADEFVGDAQLMFTYKSKGKEVTESMLEMFRRYEFSVEQWKTIKNKCDEEGILFLSTPQNASDLLVLTHLGISAIKVGSDDFTNIPLLKSYSKTGLPMIISMGMSDMQEVKTALTTVGFFDGYPTVLMLCTSQYPTPAEDVNILKLKTLAETFPQLILGFSDHTQGPVASVLALASGAKVFEKHFTLNKDLPGPDHWFSEDPPGLNEWVQNIRTAFIQLGSPEVRPTPKEMDMRILARRSVVALRDISSGEVFDEKNLGLRRPGSGIQPSEYEHILGKKALADIKKGELLKPGQFK